MLRLFDKNKYSLVTNEAYKAIFRKIRISFTFQLAALTIGIGILSCNTKPSKQNSDLDSSRIIEAAIEYIYKNHQFAPDGYMIPIKIIASPNVPKEISFLMNGKKCEVVPRPSGHEYFRDLHHPIPYFDITRLRLTKGDTIELNIMLPSVNIEHFFKVKKGKEKKMEIHLISTYQY